MSPPEVVAPTYTDGEKAQLTTNLRAVLAAIEGGELRDHSLQPSLLHALHRALFDGVRSHAGRPRAPGSGSEVLRFGRWYSARHRDVAPKLETLFHRLRVEVAELERARSAPDFEGRALRIALRAHAEVIRVHPFEDGNGRTSRLLLDLLLVRFGLTIIPIDAPRQEYLTALDAAFDGDLTVLEDLYLRLATDG